MAGGLTQEADENCLNMARQITDGEQIVILTLDEAASLKEAGAYAYPAEPSAQAALFFLLLFLFFLFVSIFFMDITHSLSGPSVHTH